MFFCVVACLKIFERFARSSFKIIFYLSSTFFCWLKRPVLIIAASTSLLPGFADF